jgi:hypothetical protein
MKLLWILLGFLLALIIPVHAQETEDCGFDLVEVETLLEESQAAYDSGDTETALTLLSDAQTILRSIQINCGVVNLTETLTIQSGRFTLKHPEGWTVEFEEASNSTEPGIAFMASSADALERLQNSTPDIRSGEQAVGVLFLAPEAATFLFDQETDFENSALGVAQAFVESIDEEYTLGTPETLSINDRRAAVVDFSGSTFEAVLYVVEYEREAVYAVVIALAAPGEGDGIQKLALEMTKSIRYDSSIQFIPGFTPSPVPSPTPTS